MRKRDILFAIILILLVICGLYLTTKKEYELYGRQIEKHRAKCDELGFNFEGGNYLIDRTFKCYELRGDIIYYHTMIEKDGKIYLRK